MSDLKSVLSALPKLNAEELDAIRARASFLRGMGASAPTDNSQLVLDAICTVLNDLGVEQCRSTMLRSASNFPAFAKKVPDLIAYFGDLANDRILLRALLSHGVDLLYKNMVEQGIPVSSRMIMQHIHRLPSTFNASYPGYAEAGLLGWVIRRK